MKKKGRMPTKSLYVAQALRGAVAAGRFAPGEFLPSELTLAYDFSVTRKTVQRGLKLLAEEGLIRSIPRIGWEVVAHIPGNLNKKICLSGIACPQWQKIIPVIKQILQREGYLIEILEAENLQEQLPAIKPSAAIIYSGLQIKPDVLSIAQKNNIHLLGLMRSTQEPYDTVSFDHFSGITTVIKKLVSEGKKNIAFLGSKRFEASLDPSFLHRRIAYENTMALHNLEAHSLLIDGYHETKAADGKVVIKWLESFANPPVDALFCVEQSILSRALVYLQQSGISAREDIQLISGGYCVPRCLLDLHNLNHLLTVNVPAATLAKTACDKLLSRLKGDTSPSTCTLIKAKIMDLCSAEDEATGLSYCE